MVKNKALKVWLEGISDLTSVESYGMSSALGATTADLPTDVPQGSTAMDYQTKTVYFFDGLKANS